MEANRKSTKLLPLYGLTDTPLTRLTVKGLKLQFATAMHGFVKKRINNTIVFHLTRYRVTFSLPVNDFQYEEQLEGTAAILFFSF